MPRPLPEVPKRLTVLVDSREQKPLLFPKVLKLHLGNVLVPVGKDKLVRIPIETRTEKLDAGDYTVAEYPGLVGIERKGSIDELAQNLCTRDRYRFTEALGRFFESYRHRALFLDCTPLSVLEPVGTSQDPFYVLDRLWGTVGGFPLTVIWGNERPPKGTPSLTPTARTNARRRLGELLLRWMVSRIIYGGGEKET